MADIKLYTGLMGSGKTYEVASLLIYDAIKQGRRVISNIAGLNQDEYYRLLELEGCDVSKLGSIVSVDHAIVMLPQFWLTDKKTGVTLPDFKKTDDLNADYIKAGDLVVLDEVWRFWDGFNTKGSDGVKRPDQVMNFMRMLRQFPHPVTGVTCDLAIITQDVSDIGRSVRSVISETYRMTKLTALGLTNRYRVDVYARAKIVKEPLRSFQRSYNPEFFGLYQSHSQKAEGAADAREINIDKRGNVLGGKLFILVLPILIICAFFAFYFVWGFFHPKPKVSLTNAQNPVSSVPVAQNQAVSRPPVQTSEWHIHGYYIKNGLMNLVLSNDAGVYRYMLATQYQLSGLDIQSNVDGVPLNNWISKTAKTSNSVIP